MDSISSPDAVLEVESGLSRSQKLQLEILEQRFRENYGANADPLDEFLKKPNSFEWPIFTILHPKISFLVNEIVDVIREAEKIFAADDLERGIQNPLLFVAQTQMRDWAERFDVIVAAGPRSILWLDTVWDFKRVAEILDLGSEIARLDSSLVEVTESVFRRLEKGVEDIKVRCDFLASRLAVVKRCEAERTQERINGAVRRRQPYASQDTNPPESRPSSTSIENDRLSGSEVITNAQLATLELLPLPPVPNRTRNGKSRPVYPIFQATDENPLTTSRSLVINHSTNKWRNILPNWSFLGEKTTVLCLLPCLMVISAILIGVAVTRSRSPTYTVQIDDDDNFFSNISQTLASLCSLYLTIIPFLRNRKVALNLFWFRVCLVFSAVAGMASVVVYAFQWQSSLVFGFFCSIFQVFATFQLIEGMDATISYSL